MTKDSLSAVPAGLGEDSAQSCQFRPDAAQVRSSRCAFRAAPLLGTVVVLICGILLWQGADRRSSGAAAGTAFISPAGTAAGLSRSVARNANASRLRVASFNIHSGVGRDGQFDLERVQQQLVGFDLVTLNEIRGATWFGPDEDQARRLGRGIDLSALFAPTERQWGCDHFGNGILSALPVQSWLRLPLPNTRGKGFRNVTLVRLELGERIVQVLCTHIDRQHDRAVQLRAVGDLFLSLAEPALLCGDLNSTRADAEIQRLLQVPGVIDAVGAHAPEDAETRIDWIFARGLRSTDAGIEDRGASDHPLVWAELSLSE